MFAAGIFDPTFAKDNVRTIVLLALLQPEVGQPTACS
jgi:hypothetical protein